MRFRFLFVDDHGEEVYVSSTEELARYVRSGSLREEALLYDSLTREWAPARTHSVFARFRDQEHSEEEESPDARGGADEVLPAGEVAATGEAAPVDESYAGAKATPGAEGPEVEGQEEPSVLQEPLPELEPLPEEAVQVDTVQLFLKEQELERWEDARDQTSTRGDSLLRDGDRPDEVPQHAPIAGSWGDTPPEPGDPGFESFLNAQRQWGRSQPPRGWAESGASDALETPQGLEAPAGVAGSGSSVARAPAVSSSPPRKSSALTRWYRRTRARNEQRSRHAGRRQFALLCLLVAVGGLGVADTWGISPVPTVFGEEGAEGPEAVEAPLNPDMEAAENEAFGDMVDGMEHLRQTMRVGEPPVTWMGGPYLSNALGFPEVREFWVRYRDYVDTLRQREEDLFRAGFVTRLRLQGVSGPAVSIRLARALRDFEADSARREATYNGMEELAVAALGLHDFLLANANRIRYAPVDQGVNDDPILEAVPLDEGTAEALWIRIERLVQALDGVADADPLQRRDVSRSVLGSLALPESTGSGPRSR